MRHVLDYGREIQNQHHSAVSQDGGSRHQVGRECVVIEGLDHQFLLAFERIHNQAVLSFADRNHQHKQLGTATGFAGGAPQS